MDPKLRQLFAARAHILKALAHTTRLIIVDELSRHDCCVAELTKLIGSDMSTVSKHLGVLKAAGIITDRKQGVQVYYSLKTPCILSFFGCVETVLRENAEGQLALVQIENKK